MDLFTLFAFFHLHLSEQNYAGGNEVWRKIVTFSPLHPNPIGVS